MWWMAIVGPIWGAFLWVFCAQVDKRRAREIEAWRRDLALRGAKEPEQEPERGYRDPPPPRKKVQEADLPKRIPALPGSLNRALAAAGGGERLGNYELVPRVAFLSFVGASASSASDYQTVVAKLEQKGPSFEVRPLAIVDGQIQPNLGLEFKKDPTFTEYFTVEPLEDGGVLAEAQRVDSLASSGKHIRKWLSRPIREALLDMDDVWLRVEGQTMILTLFGAAKAEAVMRLVETADVIFAEHGAEGGPSLLREVDDDGDDEDEDVEDDAKATGARAPSDRV